MNGKYERDYVVRHERIKNKLTELAGKNGGCFSVPRLATELGMDQRTVKAHLKILEVDDFGVFVNPKGKEFCTREGVSRLAERMGLAGIAAE